MRAAALEGDRVDHGVPQQREGLLVLAPLRAQARLPVVVGLDAVAVADVHDGLGAQPLGRPLEDLHAPVPHVVEEDVEGGLVELDDVHARRLQLPRLLVEEGRELSGELLAAAVVRVVQRVDHGHRAGERPLEGLVRPRAEGGRVVDEDGALAAHGPDDGRDARVVAVADAHRLATCEVDAAEVLDERGDEVLAGLLPVADHVEARDGLLGRGQVQRIAPALVQLRVLEAPGGPERLGLGEPRGLGEAADDRGGKEGAHRTTSSASHCSRCSWCGAMSRSWMNLPWVTPRRLRSSRSYTIPVSAWSVLPRLGRYTSPALSRAL